MSVSHASATLGPSTPSNIRKLWLEKSRIEQPRCSARSLDLEICATASEKHLIVSAMNWTKAGCTPSLNCGGGGGSILSLFSWWDASSLTSYLGRRLGGVVLFSK
jgi:hypothetical protein